MAGTIPGGNPTVQQPPQRRSLFDRLGSVTRDAGSLFGGTAGIPEELLSGEARKMAQKQGLLAFGSNLLQAGRGGGLLSNLGGALQAGQQGALGAVDQRQAFLAQKQEKERRERLSELLETNDPNVLNTMFQESLAAGDIDAARTIAEVLKTQGAKSSRKIVTGALKDGTPQLFEITDEGPKPLTFEGEPIQAPEKQGSRQFRTILDPQTNQPVIGQFNPETGGFESTGARAPSFPGEKEKQAAFFSAFLEDDSAFDAFVDKGPGRVQQFLSDKGLQELTSNEMQQLTLTGNVFAEAWLRMTTGAAYNSIEFRNSFLLFVPRSGDTSQILAHKNRNRDTLRRSLKSAEGRAARNSAEGGFGVSLVNPESGSEVRNKEDLADLGLDAGGLADRLDQLPGR